MKSKMLFLRRKKKKELDLEINSLLDVLVILLVFLLKSYDSSQFDLITMKDIKIPESLSQTLGEETITIQLSKRGEIWVNKNLLSKKPLKRQLDGSSGHIGPLAIALKNYEKGKKVNLVFDKSVPYKWIQAVMNTASSLNLEQFKFIVQSGGA